MKKIAWHLLAFQFSCYIHSRSAKKNGMHYGEYFWGKKQFRLFAKTKHVFYEELFSHYGLLQFTDRVLGKFSKTFYFCYHNFYRIYPNSFYSAKYFVFFIISFLETSAKIFTVPDTEQQNCCNIIIHFIQGIQEFFTFSAPEMQIYGIKFTRNLLPTCRSDVTF